MTEGTMLEEQTENIELPLAGQAVSRCYVDFDFALQFFDDENELTVRIGGPFHLQSGSKQLNLSPELPQDLGPALGLVRKVVARSFAYHDGRLDIQFVDGQILSVPPDTDYEAWEVVGSKALQGLRIVSLPGGELAIWKPG